MDITGLIFLTLLASTIVLSYGIYLIRQDIEELKELTERAQPQLKQELSKEDYNAIETIACHLDNTSNEGMAEVLRNIRDKYH